jgi:hypothetical protein
MNNKLYHLIESMEIACESEAFLTGFTTPQMEEIMLAVKRLPAQDREALHDRLERIHTIIEGQMMLYAEELAKLGKQITHVGHSNKATQAYRTVAVIPVKPSASNG